MLFYECLTGSGHPSRRRGRKTGPRGCRRRYHEKHRRGGAGGAAARPPRMAAALPPPEGVRGAGRSAPRDPPPRGDKQWPSAAGTRGGNAGGKPRATAPRGNPSGHDPQHRAPAERKRRRHQCADRRESRGSGGPDGARGPDRGQEAEKASGPRTPPLGAHPTGRGRTTGR